MSRTASTLLIAAVLGIGLSGCAATYTNIEPVGDAKDGKYRITEIKQGGMRLKGVVLECEGQGTTMKCKEVVVQ
jgi:hypothetical protein